MKQNMIIKILIGGGLLLMAASLLGIIGGIYGSFASLKFNETAGIGAVGNGLLFALLSNVAFFVGLLLFIIDVVKLVLKNRSGE
jgi:hypothetical protein